MRYRKDFWYILGLVIVGIAVAVMLVTMIMMYYGSNIAIVWFFAACPVLVVGFFLTQSVIRRYEDADAEDGEPLPMFWRIRYGFHNLKVLVITKGLWRVIFTALTAVSLALTLLFAGICGYSAFARNSVLKNPIYIENERKHEEYRVLWNEARARGDEAAAREYFAVMDECNKENYNSRKHVEDCTESIRKYTPWAIVTGALTAFFAVVLSSYIIRQRKLKKLTGGKFMDNAKSIPCEVILNPTDPKFVDESIREFQGCPTIAVTRKGRIFIGWYSGGTREPHMDNFNLIVKSDDGGRTWSKPIVVIPSSHENKVHSLDIQLWLDPDGRLHVYWVQNNTLLRGDPNIPTAKPGQPLAYSGDYCFPDFEHAEWEMICDEPDADELKFSEPRFLDIGFLRCKPTVLENGAWVNFNYDQVDGRYGYSVSFDKGKTYERRYGQPKLATQFDEAMAYQKKDGTVRMLARTSEGELAESCSYNNCTTWTDPKLSGIDSPNTRFYVAWTPSGRLLLVNNDHRTDRCKMTVYLSEDEGETWKYKACVDERGSLSYPDADFCDGKIYLTYDRERTGAKEILFMSFTEEDIINGTTPEPTIVSKP